MKKHLIIGKGNLGRDLYQRLIDKGDTVHMPGHGAWDLDKNYDYVWCCAGSGSVDEAKKHIGLSIDTHTRLPAELMNFAPTTTKLIFFSSTYCASEQKPESPQFQVDAPRSLYAHTKCFMERLVLAHKMPNVVAIRVGSLYGNHLPHKTFPGKLRANNPQPDRLIIPPNVVTPTPTWWLAEYLSDNIDALFGGFPIHHVSPQGFVPTHTWAKLVLGPKYEILPGDLDRERPPAATIDCTLQARPPSWMDLWNDDRNQFR